MAERDDRREFLRKSATVAWSAPLILTMLSNRAGAQALSCRPVGGPCGNNVGGTCIPDIFPCCPGSTCTPSGPNFCVCA